MQGLNLRLLSLSCFRIRYHLEPMTQTHNYLALDLGASGGRAIIGRFDGERLALEEVHRFANGPVHLPQRPRRQPALGRAATCSSRSRKGCRRPWRCCERATWPAWASTPGAWTSGCSTATTGLLGNPYHYRDSRNDTHDGRGVPPRAARGDLRGDRHPVHAAQHALSSSWRMAVEGSPSAGASRARC